MNIPRKLLIVRRDPPASGYIVMMENGDRTKSWQLSETHGNGLMEAMQEVIVTFAVQHGIITLDVLVTRSPGRPRAARTGGRKRPV